MKKITPGRFESRAWISLFAFSVLGFIAMVFSGCAAPLPTPENTVTVNAVESNNSFPEAQSLPLLTAQPVLVNGKLMPDDDLDVFSLGPLERGQTILLDFKGNGILQSNDVTVALFDGDEDLAILEEYIVTVDYVDTLALTVRKPGNYTLALAEVSPSLFRTLNYSLLVQLSAEEIPAVRPQTVFLNFNGTEKLTIGSSTFTDVRPFFELPNNLGTPAIADIITSEVQADYPNLDIQILSSTNSAEPQEPHSVVFICANVGEYYGLADHIDWYNQDLSDRAIVFTGLLATSDLTQIQFIHATANVAAHELGHLVGLAHTTDHTELMDQTTPLSLLSKGQDFHRAPLPANEFPLGWEDCVELLQFSLAVLEP